MASTLSLGDAITARLKTADGVTIYDSRVPNDPVDKYAVHYPGATIPQEARQGGTKTTRQRFTGTVVCVGHSRQQTAWVVDRIIARLVGFWPDVSPGSDPLALDSDFDSGIDPDDTDPNDIRYTHVLRYTLSTNRS